MPNRINGNRFVFGNPTVLAVDEIDSGLHVSVMQSFWENMGDLARRYNRQIFCTTHNEEMLEYAIEGFSAHKGDLRVFRVDRTQDGEVVITKYNYDHFCRAIQAEADIR